MKYEIGDIVELMNGDIRQVVEIYEGIVALDNGYELDSNGTSTTFDTAELNLEHSALHVIDNCPLTENEFDPNNYRNNFNTNIERDIADFEAEYRRALGRE